jgi:hypothetical protein
MDVERLMRDLTIDQLTEIHSKLSNEAEQKKEELRQMVGRRYRDVLDASNTVKRLTEIADAFMGQLKDTRSVASQNHGVSKATSIKKQPVYSFVLLNSILPLIGSSDDALTDVFCLLIAENLHRTVSIDPSHVGSGAKHVIRSIGDQLVTYRIQFESLGDKLGEITDWCSAAGHLAAVALLKQCSIEELLITYLNARKESIAISTKSSASFIGIIRMVRETVRCVDELFGQGQGIYSALQTVTTNAWCPDELEAFIRDQLFTYNKILRREIGKVNASYAVKYPGPDMATVQKHCTDWMNETCAMANDRIKAMCDFFERTDQMVEFVLAVNEILKSDWPNIAQPSSVYQKLFGSSLLNRFSVLMNHELSVVHTDLLGKLADVHCNPLPLFHKRTIKFDALLATGVSQELHEHIQLSFNLLKELHNNVNRYVRIGREESVQQLHDTFADAVLDLVGRITSTGGETVPSASSNVTKSESREEWLMKFRLFLGLVQHEPSVLCQCMNGNVEKIVKCNKTLHSAAENALCHFVDYLVVESTQESKLTLIEKACSDTAEWLNLVQECERVPLENEMTVEVPTQLSRFIFLFLYTVCHKVNANSIGHLFTRNVTTHTAHRLGEILAKTLKNCANNCSNAPSICTQLLFDCKTLFLMFLHKDFMEAANVLESKLDPFDLSVVSTPLSRNAKLFVQRTAMLFGQLQVENVSLSPKDNAISASYSAVVDVTPKIENPPRLTLIPRLSKLKENDERTGGRRKRPKEELLNAHMPNKGNTTSSFSSLYDKISSGWFKA